MKEMDEHPGREARWVMRAQGEAALATAMAGQDGWPYASLVLVALDQDGAPLLLISKLAQHTMNIGTEDRVSLLFAAPPKAGEDPLAGARVSVVGRARPSTELRHNRRFLARHPEAAAYAGFTDFSYFRVDVERAHLVAGFGVIHWIERSDLMIGGATAADFAEAENAIIEDLNRDHSTAMNDYVAGTLGQPPGNWCVTGCDCDGLDLLERGGGARTRLNFDRPVADSADVQETLEFCS